MNDLKASLVEGKESSLLAQPGARVVSRQQEGGVAPSCSMRPMCDLIEPSTTMDDLPEECLVHIACQLRSVRDLGAAAQASKLFRDVFYSGAATICPPSRPHLAESASHPPCLPRAHRLCVARPVRRRKTWRVVRLQRECARLVFAPRREADSTRRRCGRRAAVVRIWTAVARGVPHHE